MRTLKSSFFLRFAGGFVAGAIGVIALQPAEARQNLVSRIAPAHQAR